MYLLEMKKGLACWLMLSCVAEAGMTVITLTDAARMRLDVLSFFIFSYLALALAVKGLWNSLCGTFPKLPRLSYRRALAVLLLSGLFLYVILTMISGARELLTPGAWQKQGIGYRVRGGDSGEPKDLRKQRMVLLRDALRSHAEQHGGAMPVSPFSGELPLSVWRLADGNYYGYRKPGNFGEGRAIVAYEPATAGPRRHVLLSDGSIEDWNEGKLNDELREP